jgi:hypothetical protein
MLCAEIPSAGGGTSSQHARRYSALPRTTRAAGLRTINSLDEDHTDSTWGTAKIRRAIIRQGRRTPCTGPCRLLTSPRRCIEGMAADASKTYGNDLLGG